MHVFLAEAVRFELTDLLQSAVFKTAGLNHSPTLPQNIQIFKERLKQKTQDFLGLGFVFVRNYELLLYTNPLHSKSINLAICWAI